MSERAPYSRVYWTIRKDDRLLGVYSNDRLLATWLRLLIAADMAWPAPADLPAAARRSSLTALVDAGVVEPLPGGLFRFHGLDAERGRRRDAASHPTRGPDGPQTVPERILSPGPKTRRDETSKDETRHARERDEDGRSDLEAFLIIRGRAPTPKQRQLLDEVMNRHDLTGPAWAADIMYHHSEDPIGAVIEADKEWRAQRITEAQAAEKPRPMPRRSRGLPQSTREIMAEMALLDRTMAAEDNGTPEPKETEFQKSVARPIEGTVIPPGITSKETA